MVDDCAKLSHKSHLPTLILFTHGRISDRLEGFHSQEELRANLDRITRMATINWQIGDRGTPMQIDWRLVAME